MHLIWNGRINDGRYQLSAKPAEYDGIPPISEFYVDHEPTFYNDDILAVSSVLLFGEYCSGSINLPRKVSPEVAAAIERFLAPVWVSISPIEFQPRANPQGTGSVVLTDSIRSWGKYSSEWGKPRTTNICVLPSSEFSGYLASPKGLLIGSNGPNLGQLSRRSSGTYGAIATALLFCESLRAQSIVLDENLDDLSDNELNHLSDLLKSCKIVLQRESAFQSLSS